MEQGSVNFYQTREWRELRYKVIRNSSFKCLACGASGDDTVLHVDHIKPRSKYPELSLDESNLQVLCEACNLGKSNIYEDNLKPPTVEDQEMAKAKRGLELAKAAENLSPELKDKVVKSFEDDIQRVHFRTEAKKLISQVMSRPNVSEKEQLAELREIQNQRRIYRMRE